PVGMMDERRVDVNEINAEIARRTTNNASGGMGRPAVALQTPGGRLSVNLTRQESLAAKVDPHARAYLRERRVREAAALFEFVTKEEPKDAAALNNLGFCQIPDNPEVALHNLEKAARLGYRPQAINVYNQICCLMALGRFRAAFKTATDF